MMGHLEVIAILLLFYSWGLGSCSEELPQYKWSVYLKSIVWTIFLGVNLRQHHWVTSAICTSMIIFLLLEIRSFSNVRLQDK